MHTVGRWGRALVVVVVVVATGSARAQDDLSPPRLLETMEPRYPEAKEGTGESASVTVVLTIDAGGTVTDATVTQSGGEDFDAAALESVRQLRFDPARRAGQPIAARIPFRFDFVAPATNVRVGQEASADDEQGSFEVAKPTGVQDIQVRGDRPAREVTRRALEQREITRIAGTNGDALRSIENMPGVARPPFIAGGLIIRGSAPADTDIFVDGTVIPIAYHLDEAVGPSPLTLTRGG